MNLEKVVGCVGWVFCGRVWVFWGWCVFVFVWDKGFLWCVDVVIGFCGLFCGVVGLLSVGKLEFEGKERCGVGLGKWGLGCVFCLW